MACSIHSNCSESCSIISQSGSTREMPKLVFRGLLLAGRVAEHLCGGAIGVCTPKGLLAGVVELKGASGEPGGTVTDLEEGGREPRETVLKAKFCK
jgi:hypothetical protein